MVIIDQASRGVWDEDPQPIRRSCHYGLSNNTMEVARFLLGAASPPLDALEILDADSRDGQVLVSRLVAEFGFDRVLRSTSRSDQSPCDHVVFSEAAPFFSIEGLLPRLSPRSVVVAWVSRECVAEQGEKASPACNYLNTMWEKTVLMRRGFCTGNVCMSRVPTGALRDPTVPTLDCAAFNTEDGVGASPAEFGQDWFLYWNFYRRAESSHARVRSDGSPRVYVDVGASMPFDYSNTVILDRCLGWQGVCVEPNPHVAHFLKAYRSCQTFPVCVDKTGSRDKPFSWRDGTVEFTADCLPLGRILEMAGLHGRQIDVLSIDVEHGELDVLTSLNFNEYDIRFIIVEVTHGARWLEVDTLLLPLGYAKLAVLGRDVVYAKLEEVLESGLSSWPQLRDGTVRLPGDWAEFHQRVVDEEMIEEMRHERAMMYAGLRRR